MFTARRGCLLKRMGFCMVHPKKRKKGGKKEKRKRNESIKYARVAQTVTAFPLRKPHRAPFLFQVAVTRCSLSLSLSLPRHGGAK